MSEVKPTSPSMIRDRGKRGAGGFALVATVLLMVLLALLAIGMLSLSAVSLRTSSHGSAQAEARANARVALMVALGELQKSAGADMRITAPADILDEDNPPLTGVWRSWEGSDHEQGGDLVGRPIQPDYDSKEVSQEDDENGRFLRWLVSGDDEALKPDSAASLVRKIASDGTVPLVSTGSLAPDDDREVHVVPTTVDETGAYAWWVSGENQKALSPKVRRPEDSGSFSTWAEFTSTFQSSDPNPFGLDAALTDGQLASDLGKVMTRGTFGLLASTNTDNPPEKAFHDFSVDSVGLLTNAATGGWRKDLSLLTEKWNDQAMAGLEFFQVTPGQHIEFTRPQINNGYSGAIPEEHKRKGSVFYPWSDYRIPSLDGWKQEHWHNSAAVTSWASLADHATFYKKIAPSDMGGIPSIKPHSWNFKGGENTYYGLHGTWAVPHVARFQIIYSHFARTPSTPDPANPGRLEPAVLITPVVTLWNPYNYEIRFAANDSYNVQLTRALPTALSHLGAPFDNEFWAVESSNVNTSPYKIAGKQLVGNWVLPMRFSATEMAPDGRPALTLGPGETRVFSPIADKVCNNNATAPRLDMRPGLLHGGRWTGWVVKLDPLLPPGTTALPPATTLQADARFDQNGLANCGVRYQWGLGDVQHGTVWAGYPREHAAMYYAPPNDLPESISLSECHDDPEPFLSLVFGSKIAAVPLIKTDLDGRLTAVNRHSKGLVQASPAIKSADYLSGTWCDDYPGLDSLINSPWDFTYFYHSGNNDTYLPEASNDTAAGYIVTGMGAATGLSRLVMYDLPTRPMASVGQLNGWFLRGLNPAPPQPHDIIGNSDASPLIAANDVVHPNNAYKNSRTNLQQDDSYCANHLLFDDWFFSSIAPDPQAGKDLKANYIDLVTGEDPLTNGAYRPIGEDMAGTAAEAQKVYNARVAPTESWKTIASRLEVDGMFNVNSTSVEAWRALLGHARNHRIPYLRPNGSVDLSKEVDYAFPRSEVSSTTLANDGASNGVYEMAAEFAGCRTFTDEMLDQLAVNIVDEVRRRGPFLSLSEFVNRQLTYDKDLAIGGAIQVALNGLAEGSGSLNPYAKMQAASKRSSGSPDGSPEYAFQEAAVGYNSHGLPGWPRQSDVLKPLAPILSARDDTFIIRAYGDARDASGMIVARAWCEAVVQRTGKYTDATDESDINTLPVSPANRLFGRKFIVKSFRWLNADEV